MQTTTMVDLRSSLEFWSFILQTFFITIGLILATIAVTHVTDIKFQNLLITGAPWKQNLVTEHEREKQLKCLAVNVYREAGHEPYDGKVAVAQVTLNRAKSGQFPSEICEVVHQKTKMDGRTICQFSWHCDSEHRNRPINATAYHESHEVARRVLFENHHLPKFKDALYYHADYVRPGWKKPVVGKIGRHIFYKDPRS